MDVDTKCSNTSSFSECFEESFAPLPVVIIPSLLALGTALVVVLIFVSLRRNNLRRWRTMAHFTNGQQRSSEGSAAVSSQRDQAALRPWEIPEDCTLEGLEFLQPGHYGAICKGVLRRRDGASSSVVVKSLRDGASRQETAEFAELLLFHATVCKHQSVVQMLFCQTKRLPVQLLLDACTPGNLLLHLWSLRNESCPQSNPSAAGEQLGFSEVSVFLVAKQVAAGLDYLMSEHRLVHGDVAARNVLIGPGLSARVSGLGVAFEGRRTGPAVRRRAAEVPLKWQAPERIMMRLSIDRSDVWSYGILLYELITLGSPPYPELEPLAVLPKLQACYRMKRPKDCGSPLYDLMKYCWMWSFKDRPAFSAIIKLLESSLHLAAAKPISVPETVEISEYNRKAGLLS